MKRIFLKLVTLSIVFASGWYANEYRPKPSNTFTIASSPSCPDTYKGNVDAVNVARIEALIKRSDTIQNRINKMLRKK